LSRENTYFWAPTPSKEAEGNTIPREIASAGRPGAVEELGVQGGDGRRMHA